MTEIWLRTNRRALALGLIPPILLAAIGMGLLVSAPSDSVAWTRWIGGFMVLASAGIVVLLIWQMRIPRIAYRDGEVLFAMQSGPPLALPVDLLEAFFIGQQPVELLGQPQGSHAAVNLVGRLSQRAPEWHHREVKAAFGRWADGYVVINGTWCEPITNEVIRRLNHRLREIHEARKAPAAK
jgi:hypothetical protein